jgi:hypothetical protein
MYKFCNYCKTSKLPDEFTRKISTGVYYKSCNPCRVKQTNDRQKYKCEHDLQIAQCRVCDGSIYCEHGLQSAFCKICFDPVEITLKKMINNSKRGDKTKGRYNADTHIDMVFLEKLVDEYKENDDQCHYCDTIMQYDIYFSDLCTIERIDNRLGHSKDNCVFACMGCNRKHKSEI